LGTFSCSVIVFVKWLLLSDLAIERKWVEINNLNLKFLLHQSLGYLMFVVIETMP
jgi:hypothetical protein